MTTLTHNQTIVPTAAKLDLRLAGEVRMNKKDKPDGTRVPDILHDWLVATLHMKMEGEIHDYEYQIVSQHDGQWEFDSPLDGDSGKIHFKTQQGPGDVANSYNRVRVVYTNTRECSDGVERKFESNIFQLGLDYETTSGDRNYQSDSHKLSLKKANTKETHIKHNVLANNPAWPDGEDFNWHNAEDHGELETGEMYPVSLLGNHAYVKGDHRNALMDAIFGDTALRGLETDCLVVGEDYITCGEFEDTSDLMKSLASDLHLTGILEAGLRWSTTEEMFRRLRYAAQVDTERQMKVDQADAKSIEDGEQRLLQLMSDLETAVGPDPTSDFIGFPWKIEKERVRANAYRFALVLTPIDDDAPEVRAVLMTSGDDKIGWDITSPGYSHSIYTSRSGIRELDLKVFLWRLDCAMTHPINNGVSGLGYSDND